MQKQTIILALDIGSSSIRCSAYRFNPPVSPDATDGVTVHATQGCSSARSIKSIQPTMGRIQLNQCSNEVSNDMKLLDEIDSCVDATLEKLRRYKCNGEGSEDLPPFVFQIVGVGISTYVMNLVGVDVDGNVVEGATISYACNSKRVSEECSLLRA